MGDSDYSDFEGSSNGSEGRPEVLQDDEPGIVQNLGETCPICLEWPERDDVTSLTCKHEVCSSCLQGWLGSVVKSHRVRPEDLSCPTCRAEIDEDIISGTLLLVVHEEQSLYDYLNDQRAKEWALHASADCRAVQCPAPDCGIFQVPISVEEDACPYCGLRLCTICGSLAHRPLTCAENDQRAVQGAVGEALFSRCPQCGQGCEHVGGCNFMTCHCRAHFCHLCGTVLTREEHFSHYQGFPGSTGPFGRTCRNRQQARNMELRVRQVQAPQHNDDVQRLQQELRRLQDEAAARGLLEGRPPPAAPQPLPAPGPAAQVAPLAAAPPPPPQAHIVHHNHRALVPVEAALAANLPLQTVLQAVGKARAFNLFFMLHEPMREVLRRAVVSRNMECLRCALDEAKKVGLGDQELAEAAAVLREEVQQEQRRALRQAIARRDRHGLRQAIAASRAAGFEGEELAEAEATLRDARFAKVRADIAKALKHRSKGALYRAIVEGRAAGLPPEEVQAADAFLKAAAPARQ